MAVCLISTTCVCPSKKYIEIQMCYVYSNNLQCSYNNSHAMFYVNVLLAELFYFSEMWYPILDCRQCLSAYRVPKNVRCYAVNMKFLFIPYTGIIFVLDTKTPCHRSFFYIKYQSHSENKVAADVAKVMKRRSIVGNIRRFGIFFRSHPQAW